jgi:hypothetical protein
MKFYVTKYFTEFATFQVFCIFFFLYGATYRHIFSRNCRGNLRKKHGRETGFEVSTTDTGRHTTWVIHFRQNNDPSPNEVFTHTFTAKNTAHKRWYCHDFEWLLTGFWIIGFTDHLRIVTISNYNSLTELHTPNITVTTSHIKSSLSSLDVSC